MVRTGSMHLKSPQTHQRTCLSETGLQLSSFLIYLWDHLPFAHSSRMMSFGYSPRDFQSHFSRKQRMHLATSYPVDLPLRSHSLYFQQSLHKVCLDPHTTKDLVVIPYHGSHRCPRIVLGTRGGNRRSL